MLFCAFNFVLTILIIKVICVRKEKNIYLKNNLIFFFSETQKIYEYEKIYLC